MSFGKRPGEDLETMLKQSSDLLFCDEGGNITCCFANEICEDSSDLQENQVNLKMYTGSFYVQLAGASLGFEYLGILLSLSLFYRCLTDQYTF